MSSPPARRWIMPASWSRACWAASIRCAMVAGRPPPFISPRHVRSASGRITDDGLRDRGARDFDYPPGSACGAACRRGGSSRDRDGVLARHGGRRLDPFQMGRQCRPQGSAPAHRAPAVRNGDTDEMRRAGHAQRIPLRRHAGQLPPPTKARARDARCATAASWIAGIETRTPNASGRG